MWKDGWQGVGFVTKVLLDPRESWLQIDRVLEKYHILFQSGMEEKGLQIRRVSGTLPVLKDGVFWY